MTGVYLVSIIYTSAVFNALSCHLGSALLARKESGIMFYTTMSGGIISLLLALFLVYPFGLIGVALSMLIGNIFNFIIRIPILKKRITLRIDYHSIIILLIIIASVAICCHYCKMDLIKLLLTTSVAIVIAILFNKELISQFLIKIKNIKK